MKLTITEKMIENQILIYLNDKNIYAWKNQSVGIFDPIKKIYRKPQNKFHLKGVSDILGVLPRVGRLLAIEVKSDTGKLMIEQVEFLNRVNKEGGLGIVARSVGDVQKALEEFHVVKIIKEKE